MGPALPALAADSTAKLQAQVQQLLDRMQKMEQHNAELARYQPARRAREDHHRPERRQYGGH